MKSILYFIIPPLAARLYALSILWEGAVLVPPLMRGAVSDLAAGALAGLLLQGLLTARRKAYFLFWGLWALAAFFNAEHVTVNAANADMAFLGLALDRSFIMGSVLSWRSLSTVAICLTLSLVAILPLARAKLNPAGKRGALAALAAVLLLASAALPVAGASPRWAQMNYIEENLRALLTGPPEVLTTQEVPPRIRAEFFAQDLSGSPVISAPKGASGNVLLVIVEGIGANALKTMPRLERLADERVSFSDFISLQRQSNRGVYPLLCGEYPNFLMLEAKMDVAATYGARRPCLPEALAGNGYHTLFMRGAGLDFMQMGMFAKQIGFSETYGAENLMDYTTLGWGADDRTLYNAALERIDALEDKQPWFMTLFTVSTHHPFTIPGRERPSPAEALSFADQVLGEFLDSLKSKGVLDNTLVLITSDEVGFPERLESSGLRRTFEKSHGMLVLMVPGHKGRMSLDGAFTQADIQLSVLDYLGLDPGEATGRSVLRRYAEGRSLIFGNVYEKSVMSLSKKGEAYICTRDHLECSAYRANPARGFFGSSFAPVKNDEQFLRGLSSALAYNETGSASLNSQFALLKRDLHYTGYNDILGNHQIRADAGDTILWEMLLTARTGLNVTAYAAEPLKGMDELRVLFVETPTLKPGDTYILRRKFRAHKAFPHIVTSIFINAPAGGEYDIQRLSIKRIRNRQK